MKHIIATGDPNRPVKCVEWKPGQVFWKSEAASIPSFMYRITRVSKSKIWYRLASLGGYPPRGMSRCAEFRDTLTWVENKKYHSA